MELTQLASVLDYIDSSVHDTDLLPALTNLLVILEQVSPENPQTTEVNKARTTVIELHKTLEPVNLSARELAILESYEARACLGQRAIERLNGAFVEHFMEPAAIAETVRALHSETLALGERVTLLLKGLDPVLATDLADGVPTLEGEIVEATARPVQLAHRPATLLSNLKNRFQRTDSTSTALVPANDVPLTTKIMAAAPVVLAAAGKALEIYKQYSETKNALAKPSKPVKQGKPITIQHSDLPRNDPPPAYVRYTYRRSVVIVRDHD